MWHTGRAKTEGRCLMELSILTMMCSAAGWLAAVAAFCWLSESGSQGRFEPLKCVVAAAAVMAPVIPLLVG